MPVPSREWYVDDLIPMRQVTIVYGDGGTGKSLWALQIGAAGAMGIQTLGLTPAAGRTFYLGAEDEADEFHRRLVDITHAHGKRLKDLSDFRLAPLAGMDALLSVPDRSGNMHPTPLWTATADYVRDFKPNLVVLDTVADLFGGDEIKRGQARQFIGMLKGLAIEVNCAVILLAHPSVDGMRTGTGSSGSTGWSNSARSRLYLTRPEGKEADPDLRILKTMKINYGKVGNELKMKWHEGVFALDDGRPNMEHKCSTRKRSESSKICSPQSIEAASEWRRPRAPTTRRRSWQNDRTRRVCPSPCLRGLCSVSSWQAILGSLPKVHRRKDGKNSCLRQRISDLVIRASTPRSTPLPPLFHPLFLPPPYTPVGVEHPWKGGSPSGVPTP